jgi:hypothetical protein
MVQHTHPDFSVPVYNRECSKSRANEMPWASSLNKSPFVLFYSK